MRKDVIQKLRLSQDLRNPFNTSDVTSILDKYLYTTYPIGTYKIEETLLAELLTLCEGKSAFFMNNVKIVILEYSKKYLIIHDIFNLLPQMPDNMFESSHILITGIYDYYWQDENLF